MKLKNILRQAVLLFIFSLLFQQKSFSQCFEIESILVDACDNGSNSEGLNEMVRFKVGNTAINTSNMSVSWPNNIWGGLIRNTTTNTKVDNLNADILDAGGCGQLIQPTGGVLPANATVILVTSYNFDITSNSFGALMDNVYILFQNSNVTSGHFANYGTSATRTLSISFGGCSDTVSYDRSLLVNQSGANVAADGATVLFTPAGNATYINNGCVAPVPPFTVNAGPASLSTCAGNAVTLNGTAQGHQTVLWSAPSGTFSNPTGLATTFTPSASSAGSVVVLTLTVTNSCNVSITDTINLTVTSGTIPNFNLALTLCAGNTAPALSTTSPNGITGTWSPSVINNTIGGNYLFTPNAGQCATPVTLVVNVTAATIVPNFNLTLALCSGNTAPALSTTSPNGITGTWSPSVINNTVPGNYIFTPNAGQCATPVTLVVTVTNANIVPNFNLTMNVCTGSTPPALNTTSPNGIVGTWSPAVINNTIGGNYIFTPNAGQCAIPVTLVVSVTNANIVPDFNLTLSLCSGNAAPTLSTTSPNGITGTWSPSVINNTVPGNYIFTPNAGQCATPVTLVVTLTNANIIPNFNLTMNVCTGSTPPILNTTSPNGIVGTWSPAVINNTIGGNYIFTPNAGQCAIPVTLVVSVTNANIVPDFNLTLSLCSGNAAPTLSTTSPNGITGTWSPSVINNTVPGNYIFTPNAGQCATPVTLVVAITNANIVPNFNLTLSLCSGNTAPALNTTSPNGITGTWNPAVINNTAPGNYVFTPNSGQCAIPVTLVVTITNATVVPNFNLSLALCSGNTAPALNTTSPNGISGTWNPAVISNTTPGSYLFTPNAGQCAIPVTLNVTIGTSIIPDFATSITLCKGNTAPVLSTTSPNGIVGIWNPAVIDSNASGTYTFTPNAGQCATNVVLNVAIESIQTKISDDCVGGKFMLQAVPVSNSYNPNDVTYTWKNEAGQTVGNDDEQFNVSDYVSSISNQAYPMKFTVTVNKNGCETTESFTVYNVSCNIPKGISPNGDGDNDEFDLSGLSVKKLAIFNRYGTQVYSFKNYTKEWRGQADNGNELPDATYYYVIERDGIKSATGWVQINRQRN